MNIDSLLNKIEPFLYKQLKNKKFCKSHTNPIDLLSWNRLDLAFKLFYLDNKDKDFQLATKVYYEDIKAQTLGIFKEFGNNNKNSFDKYIEAFENIYKSINLNGFAKSKTLIPLSDNGSILNGSHRIAAAIHLNKKVTCVNLNLKSLKCDYNYFLERNVSTEILDTVVSKFIEYSNNTYIAFLWPSSRKHIDRIESKFSNVIYKKEIFLNIKGAFNLIYELYKEMDWIGSRKNNYIGIQQKIVECFPNIGPIKIIIFQSDSLKKVQEIKNEIREICNIGFSAIHITDTKKEAIRIANLLLNKNGIHFLNHANPHKYSETKLRLNTFKTFISSNNINPNNIIVDGGFILSLYGIRKSNDIDYIALGKPDIKTISEKIDNHDEVIQYYKESKQKLILDSQNYFIYEEQKFISFNQLFKMKKNRNEIKDINDCKLMKNLCEKDTVKKRIKNIKLIFFHLRLRMKYILMKYIFILLKKTGLYTPIKKIYLKFIGS